MSLLVFDSHPVQYRAPIWRGIESMKPSAVHVVYASDCSVRGHMDAEFGLAVKWDEPMLEGYAHTILNCEKGTPLSGWGSLTGEGIAEVIDRIKPKAILLTGLNYRYDVVALREGKRRKIPVWLRCETQDEAGYRSTIKSLIRSAIYQIAYRGLDRAFYIGELNRRHYLRHGVPVSKLIPARYCTVDRFAEIDPAEKQRLRDSARAAAGIAEGDFVIGFSGKLIPKKQPDILFEMLEHLPEDLRRRTCIYFLGSGEMEDDLRIQAAAALKKYGVSSFFAGFVNQSQLPSHYLAMDVLALPSRRMGETWGLVSNEGIQAGCGVIVSDAVGCSADFAGWPRFKVFPESDARDIARCVLELSACQRQFDWAGQLLEDYTIEATASAILESLEQTKA
jgi:glycosyltransferase involved in cell wall biosynthesis